MEERQIIRSYKFGIYQLLPGQTMEHQGLANPCGKIKTKTLECPRSFHACLYALKWKQRRIFRGEGASFGVKAEISNDWFYFANFGFISFMLTCCCADGTACGFLDSCTPDFLDFVNWLGEPIQLRGWKGYRAGLDVSGKCPSLPHECSGKHLQPHPNMVIFISRRHDWGEVHIYTLERVPSHVPLRTFYTL